MWQCREEGRDTTEGKEEGLEGRRDGVMRILEREKDWMMGREGIAWLRGRRDKVKRNKTVRKR